MKRMQLFRSPNRHLRRSRQLTDSRPATCRSADLAAEKRNEEMHEQGMRIAIQSQFRELKFPGRAAPKVWLFFFCGETGPAIPDSNPIPRKKMIMSLSPTIATLVFFASLLGALALPGSPSICSSHDSSTQSSVLLTRCRRGARGLESALQFDRYSPLAFSCHLCFISRLPLHQAAQPLGNKRQAGLRAPISAATRASSVIAAPVRWILEFVSAMFSLT